LDKRYALLFALILAGLIISDVFLFTSYAVNPTEREKVIISRVIDGDTIKISDGRTIRLLNINSPEKGMPGANLAAEFLKSFENKTVEIESTGTDKYQRTLARVYASQYINLEIVELGMASKFLVQNSELSKFANAEKNAISNSLGIWNKSSYFGCFVTVTDRKKEQVSITNNCPEVNIKGGMLKDESRKTYYFEDISFSRITLHSGKGEDNSTDIFWGSETNVWNDDRDSLYIFESDGRIVHYETYGY
jgi:endonuclease YncB( thermonuclease family)